MSSVLFSKFRSKARHTSSNATWNDILWIPECPHREKKGKKRERASDEGTHNDKIIGRLRLEWKFVERNVIAGKPSTCYGSPHRPRAHPLRLGRTSVLQWLTTTRCQWQIMGHCRHLSFGSASVAVDKWAVFHFPFSIPKGNRVLRARIKEKNWNENECWEVGDKPVHDNYLYLPLDK